ncbi:hypothetical protein PtA15_1A689 [Puccinia triticina]|uniref:Uncharacterized protein n=1 Tax=Puccinia triticina TaxID=208348 RepID=A0ABY7C8M6_9BASI|nr:uncharacterized protein PtA15_1A689 [Puccinia triticina]WAQ81349.1 hypothetical protein PtA15_1A689 [Puccinia triticina]
MEKIRHQPLDTLCRIVVKDPEYKRLTITNKLELDQAYRDYHVALSRKQSAHPRWKLL